VLCFTVTLVLGSPKPAIDKKPDNLNADVAKAAMENLPKIMDEFRKGNPIVEHISNTYDEVMNLYDKLDGADAFKDRNMPIELTIVNGIKKKLRYKSSYFDSGTLYKHPKPLDIPPGALSPLFVSNRQAAPTGVTGGLEYTIVGTPLSLYIGFTAPILGEYKTFIDVGKGRSAKWAYESSEDDSIKRVFKEGYELLATKQLPKEDGKMRFEYTIVPEGTTDNKKGKKAKKN